MEHDGLHCCLLCEMENEMKCIHIVYTVILYSGRKQIVSMNQFGYTFWIIGLASQPLELITVSGATMGSRSGQTCRGRGLVAQTCECDGCNVDKFMTISCSFEACRRGMRGSPAWEDAWRDALWTLAVQKRCVEASEKGFLKGMPRSKSSNRQILSLSGFY